MNKRAIGKSGEDYASKYLTDIGYQILARNYWTRYGEVDIIAQMDDTVVFVEVKARRHARYGTGIEAIDSKKIENIYNTANKYLQEEYETMPVCRFDVIEVVLGDKWEILHTKNAF